MTGLTWWEAAARQFEPSTVWATPGTLAQHCDPRTIQTPALQLIDTELAQLANTPDGRLIITMAPQEGKSERVAKWFPIWWLTRHPDTRIIVASYGQDLATRNGRAIRNTITRHPDHIGLTIAPDNGAAADWRLDNGIGGVRAVGIGGGITGHAADLIVIDDPIKNQAEADSDTYRDNVWNWWQTEAQSRLAPGAPVVLILTRWHTKDLAGRLLAEPDSRWRVINIPAQADHDPDQGETDILGREPGEFMVSARRRTPAQWEIRKAEFGSRAWAALCQGRPSPAKGGIVHRDWWGQYDLPLWLEQPDGTRITTGFDLVLQSWDMAFKATDQSDYVVGQVWARRGADMYLLDQVRGRWDFPETCRQVERLTAKWPDTVLKLVEEKANGAAVIAALQHRVPGLVPENPVESKVARVNAVAPLIEARNVHLPAPALAAWVGGFIEEWAAFPTGAHDDQVDPGTQALRRLSLIPILTGGDDLITEDDIEELRGWTISPV